VDDPAIISVAPWFVTEGRRLGGDLGGEGGPLAEARLAGRRAAGLNSPESLAWLRCASTALPWLAPVPVIRGERVMSARVSLLPLSPWAKAYSGGR